VRYTIDTKGVQTASVIISIKNKGSLPAVINSYSIFIPFSQISNIKVGNKSINVPFSTYTTTSGKRITVRFNNKVVDSKSSYQFTISFNTKFDLDSNWGYLKLPIKFGDLNINKIIVTYPEKNPKPAYISETNSKVTTASGNNVITITNQMNPYLSILFGVKPTYSFKLKKNYINYASTNEIYDLILPSSIDEQNFVIEGVTPTPEYIKSDNDGNIILGFKVEAQKQINININGYIVKDTRIKTHIDRVTDDDIGYWTLADSKEIARVKAYISSHKYEKDIPTGLTHYIIDNFEIEKLNSTSLENVLRGGINVAINRKSNAIVEDFADCLIAYLRYYGFQARMVIGYIPSSSIYSQTGFFSSWVEYYDKSKAEWVLLDPAAVDFNKMSGKVSQNDRIPFILRETNPITPKLQYFKSDEISINPTSETKAALFKYSIVGNTVKNTGNVIISVKTEEKTVFLLPGSSLEIITYNENIIVSDLVNRNINEKIEVTTDNSKTNSTIFSELILFTTFSASLLLLSFIYSRIRKKWKSTHR
jgi:hypothetical protein